MATTAQLLKKRLSSKTPQVVAVVVAYNRRELLKECLDAIEKQIIPPDQVIVVDNASTDGSAELASAHPVVHQIVRLPENTGGAGGFTAGIAHALRRRHLSDQDYLWIMDDDTIPQPNALAELLKAADKYSGKPAVLASKAIWTNGQTHPMNTHRARPLLNRSAAQAAAAIDTIPVRAASFVSILIEVGQVRANGLPIADYFIWNDDLEYTARLLKNRVGLYVPSSIVLHKTKALASATDAPGDRLFYEVRNKLWFLRYSKGLHPQDRLLYGLSTIRRWIKIFIHSSNRSESWTQFKRGVNAALASPPRKNREIFQKHPETARLVTQYDQAASGKLPSGEVY